jgi:hypothetical protein
VVFRITLDTARRKWLTALWSMFQFYLPVQAFTQLWPWIDPMGIVLVGAGFFALAPGLALQSRELYQLPVSRRTWSQAQWWLAVGGAAIIPVTGITIGLRVHLGNFPGLERVVMYSFFAFLYCAGAMTLRRRFAKAVEAPATLVNMALFGPIGLAFAGGSLWLGARLPHSFGEINAMWAVAILLMGAWAAVGYLHQPEITPRPGRGGPSLLASWKQEVSGRDSKPVSSRLSGLQLVIWYEARAQAATFAFLIVAAIVGWASISLIKPMPAFTEFLRMADLLPFSSARAQATEIVTWGLVLFMVANVREPWVFNDRRHLRSLPLSPASVSCLPLALAVLSTLVLWTVLLILHFLVLRSLPISPRSDLFMAFAGFTAVGNVIRLIGPRQGILRAMVPLAPITLAILASEFFTDGWRAGTAQPLVVAFGAFMMAASFATLRFWLTRSSSMYRWIDRRLVPRG